MSYSAGSVLPFAVRRQIVSSRPGFIASLRLLVLVWRKRARDRAELARMDYALLRDIGADRATVDLEVARAFWQAPLAAWRLAARARSRGR